MHRHKNYSPREFRADGAFVRRPLLLPLRSPRVAVWSSKNEAVPEAIGLCMLLTPRKVS